MLCLPRASVPPPPFSSALRCSLTHLNWSAPGLLLRRPENPGTCALCSPETALRRSFARSSAKSVMATFLSLRAVKRHPIVCSWRALRPLRSHSPPSCQVDTRLRTPARPAPCAVRRLECARTSSDVTTRRSEWLPRLVCGFLSDAPASCAVSRQALTALAVSSMSSRRSSAASPARQAALQAAFTIFGPGPPVMCTRCVL